MYTLDKFSHIKILASRCKYESLWNWPWFYEVVHNIFKNYIPRLCFMLLSCVNFIILIGICNFRKLSLLPKVKRNLFCTLSVDFSFREFWSFQSNLMAKGNLTNITFTYPSVKNKKVLQQWDQSVEDLTFLEEMKNYELNLLEGK